MMGGRIGAGFALSEVTGDKAHEQRIAAGAPVQGGGQPSVGRPRQLGQPPRHVLDRQAVKCQGLRMVASHQLADGLEQRARCPVAVGHQHTEPFGCKPRREMPQQQHRHPVGPVHVPEDDEQAGVTGPGSQRPLSH